MVFQHGGYNRDGGYLLTGTFYNQNERKHGKFELIFDGHGSFVGRWKWDEDRVWQHQPWSGQKGGGRKRGGRKPHNGGGRKTRRKKNERKRKTRTKNKRH